MPFESAEVPEFYVVPSAWREVSERLQYNNVEMIPLKKDTVIQVTSYYINKFEFLSQPYEGHFLMKDVEVRKEIQQRKFRKGDYLVPTDQKNRRFLVSVLEPTAVDSYLRWNFFDEIFRQKEYFSPYVFEDTAEKLLAEDEELQEKFEKWQLNYPEER